MENMENTNNYIILDIGSGYCKAGFSGDAEPQIIIPTVVGHPKGLDSENIDDANNLVFGQEALDNKNKLNIVRPVQKGIVTDWENLTYFLDNLFKNELKIDPKKYGMFFTDTPLTPNSHREKLTELMFEKFQIPNIFLNNRAICTMWGANKEGGFVVDSGYDISMVVPNMFRLPYQEAIKTLDVGGRDINEYIEKLLIKNGVNPSLLTDSEINKFKEKYCYIAENSTNEEKEKKDIEMIYELPDKTKITIKDERFLPPEINFHPELIGKKFGGLAQIFCLSMYENDHYYENDHFYKQTPDGTVVLAGGNTLLPNFAERLTKEIQKYYGGKFKNRIEEMFVIPQRKYIQWIGASIFSLLHLFNRLCTTYEDYLENGASIINKNFFY